MIKYLEKEEFVYINYRTVKKHSGNFMPLFNFLQEDNLHYLLEAVLSVIFGIALYPSITDKAALLCYIIICNHIFLMGIKGIGLEASLVFLRLNGLKLNDKLPTLI